jgi:hypothetical protein
VSHLQFEAVETLDERDVRSFTGRATDCHSELVDSGTDHVGVTVRDDVSFALGRAEPDAPVAVLSADVRAGRTVEQRRELAVTVIAELSDRREVATENACVGHAGQPGKDVHLRRRRSPPGRRTGESGPR